MQVAAPLKALSTDCPMCGCPVAGPPLVADALDLLEQFTNVALAIPAQLTERVTRALEQWPSHPQRSLSRLAHLRAALLPRNPWRSR